ncbi:Mut7-C RNAse domain-containing protein [Haloactinomyces albus]|uniref:Uncharacterized protein with PIN domain n=1 Tax=Haloactinomyces albus TaxID=1352928 RepID=A0AAE4CMI1_9ACTN|nr:Mut7-C RNAse domain-containing protein [Haloactinomyces albus]MDR7302441.1 uncharacterized protein with PIN domain [Haloactinomyces albus]
MASDTAGTHPTLRVRPDRELWSFVAPRHRREQVLVRYDGTASLGHVVQSLGIPLTEVGALLVDGVPTEHSQRPGPAATVEIRPVERPQAIRAHFVLDVHLGTLARRMRLLGIDTAYRNDAEDGALIEQSAREERVLLSKDRGLLRRRALWSGAFVRGTRPAEQLADVLGRFAPGLNPWTRCLACNGELAAVAKSEVVDELEPGTRRCYDVYARCRSCGRVYWRGAHADKLDAIVAEARSMHPDRGEDGRG